jgi:hypothetical protein
MAVVGLGVIVVRHLLRLLGFVVGSIDVLDDIENVGHALLVLLGLLFKHPALLLQFHLGGDMSLNLLPGVLQLLLENLLVPIFLLFLAVIHFDQLLLYHLIDSLRVLGVVISGSSAVGSAQRWLALPKLDEWLDFFGMVRGSVG